MDEIIKNVKYIYVDSLHAVNHLKKKIDLNNYTLISFNPSLVLKKELNINSLEHNSNPKDFINLGRVNYNYSGYIYNKVIEFNNDSIMGIWIARYLISMQNIMYRANKIKTYIQDKKCLFVMLDFEDSVKNLAINGNLPSYMSQYKNCKILEIKHTPDDLRKIGRDPQTKFLIRLNFESAVSILFRLICIVSRPFYNLWPGKKIYYSQENTLLKRIAFKCFLKGYLIQKFPNKNNFQEEKINTKEETLKIFNYIKDIIILYQKEVLGYSYTQETKSFFYDKIKHHINQYIAANKIWTKEFSSGSQKKITACLLGFPSTAMEIAFASLAKNNNIITASFQHAISKEISEDILSTDTLYESNIVDYYFVYGKRTAVYSKYSRFHKAEDIQLGLPEDLKKGMLYKNNNKFCEIPVLYASTSISCGNRGITSRAGSSDVEKAEFELDFIENILGRLPHKVQYKPYFSKRYTGDVIEIDKAKSKKNIFVNLDEIDLRYIVNKSRLIITSRSTSTVGWCIFSSKPVIYIENTDNRLNKEASEIFKKSLFFFDVLDPKWKIKLYNLLKKDISTIENEWIEKQKLTDNLIYKFLGYKKENNDHIAINKIIKKLS
mgnify:FL=1